MKLERPDAYWFWIVPRQAIGRAIRSLAASLRKLHFKGEIHGDINPANLLATNRGLDPIDSLGLAEGDLSPAMTPGWAAPEQVAGFRVAAQTDQYPIGLMLLWLVGGAMYG